MQTFTDKKQISGFLRWGLVGQEGWETGIGKGRVETS